MRTARTIRSHIERDHKDSLDETNQEWIRCEQRTAAEQNEENLALQMAGVNGWFGLTQILPIYLFNYL